MDKDQLIDALIDNAESPFTEEDRETLNSFEEDKLAVIANKVGCGDTVTGPEGPNAKQVKGAKKFVKPKKQGSKSGVETKNAADADDDEGEDNGEEEKMSKNAEMTEDEYINAAPPGIRESLIHNRDLLVAEKAKLVTVVMNNAAGVKFNKAALAAKTVDELQAMAALAGGPTRNQRREQPQSLLQNNYAGLADAGGNSFTANEDAGEPEPALVCPTLNFSRNS